MKYQNIKSSLLAICFATGAQNVFSISFDDIHFWTGSGASRAAIVLDLSKAGGESLVWGYKWNGTAPSLETVLKTIADSDPRLWVDVDDWISGIELDVDEDGIREIAPKGFYVFDPDTWEMSGMDWHSAHGSGDTLESIVFEENANGAAGTFLEDGQWYSIRFEAYATDPFTWEILWDGLGPENTKPATSPYGWRVVSAYTDCQSPMYCAAANTLGRPTDLNYPGDDARVVSPINPAWNAGTVFSIEQMQDEEPAHITIEFDHKVYDDPANPYGLDFIVFGNSMISVGDITLASDPEDIELSNEVFCEPALVEVSQDGVTWYAFEDGPFADGFAPTLGRLYDRAHPDTTITKAFASALVITNSFWSARLTDATLPIDPDITEEKLGSGDLTTLAQLCKAYNGSAGGTAFDIAAINGLECDQTGRRWIRYVRISSVIEDYDDDGYAIYSAPDIDAVADVAPRPGYDLWARTHYGWHTAVTNSSAMQRAATAPNGLPNTLNAAMGISPFDTATKPQLRINSFCIDQDTATIGVAGGFNVFDLLEVKASTTINGTWSDAPAHSYKWIESLDDGYFMNYMRFSLDPELPSSFFKVQIK